MDSYPVRAQRNGQTDRQTDRRREREISYIACFAADSLNDVYVYSPANGTWAALAPIGSSPSPRHAVSMVAAPDGALYVLGGITNAGRRVRSAEI
jgi:hypothetical protein